MSTETILPALPGIEAWVPFYAGGDEAWWERWPVIAWVVTTHERRSLHTAAEPVLASPGITPGAVRGLVLVDTARGLALLANEEGASWTADLRGTLCAAYGLVVGAADGAPQFSIPGWLEAEPSASGDARGAGHSDSQEHSAAAAVAASARAA